MSSLSYSGGMLHFSIDVGGTKVSIAGFDLSFDLGSTGPVFMCEVPLVKGVNALASTIISLWEWGIAQSGSFSVLPRLFIGCPGVWHDGRIVEGTAINLESFPGEFDSVALGELIQKRLPSEWGVQIQNDAWCQAKGGILLSGQMHQKWCYVGPGTGLGGALFEVNGGEFVSLDKGHWAGVELPVLPHDFFFTELWRHGKINAEAVLSGAGVLTNFGMTPLEMIRIPGFEKKFEQELLIMSGYFLSLLGYLNMQFQPDVFLIGGSLGTKPPFSDILLSSLRSEDVGVGLPPIIQILDSRGAALVGALL